MRGFSESDKHRLREALVQKGHEFFSLHGLKKTSIKELTEAVGIAQGSFYLFFSSKEELYFHVLEEEEKRVKQLLLQSFPFGKELTPQQFSSFLLKGIQLVQKYPLLQRLFFSNDIEAIMRKLPPEIMEKHIAKDEDDLSVLLSHLPFSLNDQELKIISGAVRSFFLMALHEKEIGKDQYDETLVFLAEAIANRIFEGREER